MLVRQTYAPFRIETYDRIGDSESPGSELKMALSASVLKRWSCLSAPVAMRRDEVVSWLSSLLLGCLHASTEQARMFDDVGVSTILGLEGAVSLVS